MKSYVIAKMAIENTGKIAIKPRCDLVLFWLYSLLKGYAKICSSDLRDRHRHYLKGSCTFGISFVFKSLISMRATTEYKVVFMSKRER